MNFKKFCEQCSHYKFDLHNGIICGLTRTKPSFEDECKNFKIDPNRVKLLKEREHYYQMISARFLRGYLVACRC